MGEIDRLQLRVGDADRHQVAEILRRAAGDGRLGLDELDQRLEATFAAKTYADLVPLTVDLPERLTEPESAPARPAAAALDLEPEKHLAILGGFERKGVWTVPPTMKIVAVLGGAELDFRQAAFSAGTCELRVNAMMGGVNLVVPHDVRVIFSMVSILGGHSDDKSSDVGLDAPTLVIKGTCVLGGVNVERKGRRELAG